MQDDKYTNVMKFTNKEIGFIIVQVYTLGIICVNQVTLIQSS